MGVEDERDVLDDHLVPVIYEPLGREDPAGLRTFGSDPCHSREEAAFASLPAQQCPDGVVVGRVGHKLGNQVWLIFCSAVDQPLGREVVCAEVE